MKEEIRMQRVRRAVLATATVLGLLVVAVPAALADNVTRSDPDDSTGGLDIASIAHSHSEGVLVHRFSTYEAWDTAVLQDGLSYAKFNFFIDQRYITATVDVEDDGTLYAEIRNFRTQRIIGFAKVWRPDERSLRIEFPKRVLGRGVTSYRWSALTSFHQQGHESCDSDSETTTVVACGDPAPTRGFITHRL